MPDHLTTLRSLAAMPWIAEAEERRWRDAIEQLDPREFAILMEPLLEDNRKGLVSLPKWSNSILFARFMREGK